MSNFLRLTILNLNPLYVKQKAGSHGDRQGVEIEPRHLQQPQQTLLPEDVVEVGDEGEVEVEDDPKEAG